MRSSHGHFVKTSGWRWLSLMLLVEIPWAQRVWALPFFTVLAPSERYSQIHRHRHKSLTDWGRQMLRQLRGWLAQRDVVVVADSSFVALELLSSVSQMTAPVHMVTRLRLDAALYEGRTCAPTNTDGAASTQGQTLSNSQHNHAPCTNRMAVGSNPRLVWGKATRGRTDFSDGSLVSHWLAACAYSLGVGA